ncbi:MAG: hypothetical protein ACTHMS_06060 [Jatrophihabitans sp.]|uniref:hypothetical protein n=1 Tax=Jatrophihabitans sp. TaxID=1932789 RepID=UPI003F815875
MLQAIAVHRVLVASVISHDLSALGQTIPLLGPPSPVPILTLPPYGDGSSVRAHVHRATLREQDVVMIDGAAFTSPARTCVDLTRRSVKGGVVAMDAAVQRRMTTFAEIDEVLAFCSGWPGIARARKARGLSDGIAESPIESLSRLLVIRLRLPVPKPQARIYDLRGRFIARGDFYWDEYGVLGEVDGKVKYIGNDVLISEKLRQEALEDLRVTMTRWGAVELGQPRSLEAKIQRAFARGRALDESGALRRWKVKYAPELG